MTDTKQITNNSSIHDTVEQSHKQLLADHQVKLSATGKGCTKIITVVQLVKQLAGNKGDENGKTIFQYNRISSNDSGDKPAPQLDIVLSLAQVAELDTPEWTLQTELPVHPKKTKKSKKA
ncbi:hypothetical protein CJU89_3676 [Yarrowia sp. B02]|nr:hypothetical protein CJU89_3676 [Yarrowia sp. B02]